MASGFVPVTGVQQHMRLVALTDVCVPICCLMWPRLWHQAKQSSSHLIALLSERTCQKPNLQPRIHVQPCSSASRRKKPHKLRNSLNAVINAAAVSTVLPGAGAYQPPR